MSFRFHHKYFLVSLLLFIVEILIAIFVRDAFIRPYFGDFLVVILIYCFLKGFLEIPVLVLASLVLLFSYLVEVLQLLNFISFIGLQDSELIRIVLGTGFAWWDILAYTLGALFIVAVESKYS